VQVLGFAVAGLCHQLHQAGAGLAEVCQARVAEFVEVPPAAGSICGGGGVEQGAGLPVGQPRQAGVGADVAVGGGLAGAGSAVSDEQRSAGAALDQSRQ
jgi:hypothetical protein